MAKAYLQDFVSEPLTIKAVGLYLGAATSEYDGSYSHQLALLPSERDPKGGVIVLKADKNLAFKENLVYMIEARSNSAGPSKNYGITAYYLHTPTNIKAVAKFDEKGLQD